MKISFFELEQWEKEYVKERLPEHELSFHDKHLDESTLAQAKEADAIAIFIYSAIAENILAQLPKLKLVTTMSTGYDHINLPACKKRGITVCTVPSYGENTVAEHAMALLLAISKKIPQSVERVKRSDMSLEGMRGFDLKGKTIGVIGTGKIGQNLIKMCKGFDMGILMFDAFPNRDLEQRFGAKYVDLDYLLANSDVISLHAPYMESTHHLLNKGNMAKIKRGAVLINTARGGLIETEALLHALEQGTISFAGLDVLEGEQDIKEEKQLLSKIFNDDKELKIAYADKVLISMPNVFVTPHNAFNSTEALMRILDTTVDNIRHFAQGNPINALK